MDIELIAREIVRIKNRLQELDEQNEGDRDADADERKTLLDTLRRLQDRLSTHGAGEHVQQDDPASPGDVHYVPPA